jgi:hypothetical protein
MIWYVVGVEEGSPRHSPQANLHHSWLALLVLASPSSQSSFSEPSSQSSPQPSSQPPVSRCTNLCCSHHHHTTISSAISSAVSSAVIPAFFSTISSQLSSRGMILSTSEEVLKQTRGLSVMYCDYCNLVIPSKSLQLRKNRRERVGKNLVEIYNRATNTSST